MSHKGSVKQRHTRKCKRLPDNTGYAEHKCRGPWQWMVDIGTDPITGRRIRETKSGYDSKTAADAGLGEFLKRQGVTKGRSEDLTVSAWLDRWLASLHSKSPTTVARYEGIVRLHLRPLLGHIRLVDLTADHIDGLIKAISQPDYQAPGRNANRWKNSTGLTSAGVNRVFDALRAALQVAVNREYLHRNPAAHVTPPEEVNAEGTAWTPEQAARFLDFTADHRLYAAWHLVLVTGVRRGEICGAGWDQIDLDEGYWDVKVARVQIGGKVHEKRPKSKAGVRRIYLDAGTVTVLRAHRRRQQEERLAAGPAWVDSGRVFTKLDGRPLVPGSLSLTWRTLVRRSGLPPLRLHDGRHTSTTTAVMYAEVPQRVLLERVGHTKTATNLIYQHVHTAVHRAAAEGIAAQYQKHRRSAPIQPDTGTG